MFKPRFLFVFLLTLAACSKDKFEPVYSVPTELQYYVDAFETEAAKRGHPIKINNLIIEYSDTLPLAICGQSNVISNKNDRQKIIVLKAAHICWSCPNELEDLIFHELGHCVLGRTHDDGLLPNGDPRSIMVSYSIRLYSSCSYNISGMPVDNSYKRDYYVDELFDPSTPVPDWGK